LRVVHCLIQVLIKRVMELLALAIRAALVVL